MTDSRPILIAYDGSAGAHAAIEVAGRLFAPREAIVLSVRRSLSSGASASLIAIPAAVAAKASTELDAEAQQHADALAAEGATAAKAAGLDATPVGALSHEDIWPVIVNAAEEEDVAAVVVGTRGLSAVKSAVLGSVSNGVVRHCSRPVLVVPPAS